MFLRAFLLCCDDVRWDRIKVKEIRRMRCGGSLEGNVMSGVDEVTSDGMRYLGALVGVENAW